MPNHSREEMEKNEKLGKSAIASTILGTTLWAISKSVEKSRKQEAAKRDQARLDEIQMEIASYRGKFMGGILYANEISELESEAKAILAKYGK